MTRSLTPPGTPAAPPTPKSTLPPTSDPDLERFEQDVKEAGEYEARLAELARKILAPPSEPRKP